MIVTRLTVGWIAGLLALGALTLGALPAGAVGGPTTTVQPVDARVYPGVGTLGVTDGAVFSVAATGTGTISYQWQTSPDGITWADVTSGTGPTAAEYVTGPVSSAMSGTRYRVRLSDTTGTSYSNAATLHVLEPTGVRNLLVSPRYVDPAVRLLRVAGEGFDTATTLRISVFETGTWTPGQEMTTAIHNQRVNVQATVTLVQLQQYGGFFRNRDVMLTTGLSFDPTKSYGLAVYSSTFTNRAQDYWQPLEFAPPPDAAEQAIGVTVPEFAPGELVWEIDADDNDVSLTEATNAGASWQSTGEIKPIKVTDSRPGGGAWSISGQVSDFTGGVSGTYLGWTPKVTAAGSGAAPGVQVQSGFTAGNGLKDASMLASATVGHAGGTATLGADLDLKLPIATPAGTYSATLTITALS